QLFRMQKRWRPIFWAEEKGVIAYTVDPLIKRYQAETRIPIARKQFTPKQDKVSRAQSIRGYIAMHGLYVPTKASWYPPFAQELLSSPVAKNDDQVDALAMIGQLLDVMAPPSIAVVREKRIMRPQDFRDYAIAAGDQISDAAWSMKML